MVKKKQLLTILKELYPIVEDRDEFGSIIGYCVIKGLMDLKTDSGSKEEIQFEEVKQIHSALENAIDSSLKNNSYSTLCNLQVKVNPYLSNIGNIEHDKTKKSIITNKIDYEVESNLLIRVLNNILFSRRNYEDSLRKLGLKLYNRTIEEGCFIKTFNILTNDYNLINETFTRK